MSKRKLCDECKTGFPAKCLVQYEGYFLLICDDCRKKLNSIPKEQAFYPDVEDGESYEANFLNNKLKP